MKRLMVKILKQLRKVPTRILILVAVLIVIRAFLPMLGKWGINWALENKLGQYQGRIEDFDLSLYRGAYQVQELSIKKRDSQLAPLLFVENIDLSLAWRALFRGEISADIDVSRMAMRLFDSREKETQQLGTEEKNGWKQALDVIIPVSVESLKINDSSVYFTNRDLREALPIRLEGIYLDAKNLRTPRYSAESAASPFEGRAVLQGHAAFSAKGEIDAISTPMAYNVDLSLIDFHPNSVNNLLRAYIPIDITKGSLSIYSELASANGDATGYAKFFMKDGDIIASTQKFISFKHFAYEILGAFGNWLLKNSETKSVASRVSIDLHNGVLNVSGAEAFWSAIKNMWDTLPPGLEHSVDFKSLENNKQKIN